MYAIVDIAGKQFKVTKDQFVYAPSLAGEEGASVEFDRVLLFDNDNGIEVGAPVLSGVTVAGKILEHGRGDKVIVFKKKRRKGYKKTQGHRQGYTKVLIEDILAGGKKVSAKKEEPAKKEEKKADRQEEKGTATSLDQVLKSVGTAKAEDKDDLKKIKGIGEVFEKALNDHGIYTYQQISKLKSKDMDALAEVGGITRHLIEDEDWVDQAKELMKKEK